MFEKRGIFKIRYRGDNFFMRNLGVLLSVAVIFVSLIIGVYIGKQIQIRKFKAMEIAMLVNKDAEPDSDIAKKVDFAMFWQIWEKIRKDFVHQPVDEVDAFYGAISGMVASLDDPYSVFLKPQIAEEFEQDLAGKFEGIGAEIGIRNDQLTIVAPLLDSPAEIAGLKAGDRILAINDYDTRGILLNYAVKLIRGKKGTSVKLLIMREGFESPQEFEVIRDKIVVKSIQWHMEGEIAYIRVLQFGNDTVKDFDKVVREIVLKNPKGVILDLRNNPGGFLDAAIEMAGEWVPNKPVVYERFQNQDQEFIAYGKGRLKDFGTVVLINGGSASGSEIVAGALKDYNEAVLVGEKTFGKGSVQDYSEYPDGSALKLTIALWLTPNKDAIDGTGIEPDILVEITEEDVAEERDAQLEKAKDILTK